MGTRSTIAIRNADGTVTGIYCHWDGYFSHNGRILQDHYNTEDRVRELLALGFLSSLRPEIGEKHPFDTWSLDKSKIDPKWDNWCKFYGRDRDEADQDAELFGSWNDLLNKQGQEYNYLFVPGEGWYVDYSGEGWGRSRGKLVDEMGKELKEEVN